MLPDGSYELVLTGQQLLGRIALLVPRPRVHLVRYHGIFAPRSHWRRGIVPAPSSGTAEQTASVAQPQPASPSGPQQEAGVEGAGLRARRLDWARLMKRVFGHDVMTCDRCGGRRRVIA